MKKIWIFAGLVIAIAIGFYTISPLFINKTVDEPIPENVAIDAYNKFETLSNEERLQIAAEMTDREKNIIMIGGEKVNKEINDDLPNQFSNLTNSRIISGTFKGVDDGIHNAEGIAKILFLEDGTKVLRFEDFKSTNGPDLRVYLATNTQASDYIDLGPLKGNIGNQNYQLPLDIDLLKYNNVLVWCRAFSVLLGNAQLT